MTAFTTFLDVSRDEGDSDVYMLAGFISEPERWDVFDSEWQDVLDEYGISIFHMTDFESRWGEFKDWERDDPRRIPLLTALIEVIEHTTVGSVGYGVSRLMYDSVVSVEVNEAVGGSAYFFLFLNLVIHAEHLMDNAAKLAAGVPYDWQMLYMLARDDQGAGKVMETWMSRKADVIATRMETRMKGLSIVTDNTKYPALQAADLLAFEGRKQVGLQLGHHQRKQRASFEALDGSRRPRAWKFYQSEDHLRASAETIQREVLGDKGSA